MTADFTHMGRRDVIMKIAVTTATIAVQQSTWKMGSYVGIVETTADIAREEDVTSLQKQQWTMDVPRGRNFVN